MEKNRKKQHTKIEKECNHKFIHIVIKSRCMYKEDKKIYDWLCHKCVYCNKIGFGEKLE